MEEVRAAMKAKVIPMERQNLIDLSIQYCGDIEHAFKIASLNDMDVCCEGDGFMYVPVMRPTMTTTFFKANKIYPASES